MSSGHHDARIERPWSLPESTGGVLLAILVAAILVLDYTAGRDFSLHLFYLVPTGLAAWSFGARAGYAVGLMAALYWAFVGFATRHPNAAAVSLAWDVASTIALFLFFAFVVGRHRAFVDNLLATARIDASSGALAKREFERLFESEVRRARRYRRPLAICLIEAASAREARAIAVRLRTGVRDVVNVSAAPAVGLLAYGGIGKVSAPDLEQLANTQISMAVEGAGMSECRID